VVERRNYAVYGLFGMALVVTINVHGAAWCFEAFIVVASLLVHPSLRLPIAKS